MSDRRVSLGKSLPPFMMVLFLLMVLLRHDEPVSDAWAILFALNFVIVVMRLDR